MNTGCWGITVASGGKVAQGKPPPSTYGGALLVPSLPLFAKGAAVPRLRTIEQVETRSSPAALINNDRPD